MLVNETDLAQNFALFEKCVFMADDKSKRGKADRDRVSLGEGYEVEDLHQKYPQFTHEEIRQAIQAAGPSRERVEDYLNTKQKR